MIRDLARRALAAFTAWRERRRAARNAAELARRLAAANPAIARLQNEIAERARRHRKVEPLRRQLRALITARLAEEQGRTPERSFS